MEKIYRVTNDSYSNDPIEVTIAELRAMCAEMGWDVELLETIDGRILDQNDETVGYTLETIAEMDAE